MRFIDVALTATRLEEVVLRPQPGALLENCSRDAFVVAARLWVRVTFKHNDLEYLVTPESLSKALLKGVREDADETV
jgi:hypothetical protein